jgi:hypothetical protein
MMLEWLIVMAVGVLIWRLIVRRADCVVRVRNGRVQVRGRLSAGRRQRIEQFLLSEVSAAKRLRIEIEYARASAPLRIRVRGRLSPGDRQMIRNFLLAEL